MFAKKNVVAAAALTLVAVAAQAQVTVYGNLDVSVGRKEAITGFDSNGKAIKSGTGVVDSNDMSPSFIGFKGQEDLGGGLKALFKLESDLAVDSGATAAPTFWNRNATVGVAGGFGTLNLGRFENLFYLEGAAFNPFGKSATFSPTQRAGLGGGAQDRVLGAFGFPAAFVTDFDTSWANGVSYVSPNLGGLTLSAQYAAKEGAKGTATTYSGGAYAIAANYQAGPFGASLVVGRVKSVDATNTGTKNDAWQAGISYDFTAVKLFAQYGRDKVHFFGEDDTVTPKFFQVGASIPVTADGAVLVSYGESKGRLDDAGDSISGKVRDFSLGYDHNLSKRTDVYAALNNERIKGTATLGGVTGSLSGNTTGFSVGVRHRF